MQCCWKYIFGNWLINYSLVMHKTQLLLLRPGRGAKYCDQPARRSVCLSVCPRAYLRNRWTDRHGILCAAVLWRGSVLLWRRCDTLCTSGFMDYVTFDRIMPYGDSGVAIPWRSPRSLMYMNDEHFFTIKN